MKSRLLTLIIDPLIRNEPVTSEYPFTFQLPVTYPEPVSMSVSIPEKVELPVTLRDPLTIAPLDAVTDERCAALPLTIIFFQLDNRKLHDLCEYCYKYVVL